MDKSQIATVRDLVDARNDMAHASGKFNILTEDAYDAKVKNVLSSIRNIHKCMNDLIRKWYSEILISFCAGEFSDYKEARDLLIEYMIQSFKLSVNELLVCHRMSVSNIINQHRRYKAKLKHFKDTVADYCQEIGYI